MIPEAPLLTRREAATMVIWTLAKKELLLLLRDRLAAILLFGMPLVAILLLGLLLGEGFWQKPDERLRVSVVDEDRGYVDAVTLRQSLAWLGATPDVSPMPAATRLAEVTALQRGGPEATRLAGIKEGMSWFALTPG